MPTVNRQAFVPYSPQEMYALVNDVRAYPQFLPGCRSSAVLAENEDEVTASIELAKGAVHKSFTTRNRLQTNKMIEMRLVDGPFRHLEGFWRFDAMGDKATRVSLDLEFEFSNRLMGTVIGPIFNQVANSLVDSFVKRARQVYGPR
ncbi:Ribosome association toxin PasT (RatA) of the RatAB toxin-antitoxin module [Ectothiorhodosinus mongolicus]|uniref:Ribosome association toxin PasT (RatA) of the RatAB toxin-antitoxin module n=1 Tax=Ectothiorhodosinus mongolicus TaxID=233100 RepID=A0A1R3VNU7_9GAMM|nr:type II toxin-antitoxin system RatA family toxin [Ectothiorhodosinus mongolicus]ULX56552.1 ubiquinone-binding protein [Ectothiorhodosinus mongolicus]SIT66299.1 Ribosome association toxin PasT (RatA) of the RatAB toxin-antitoxin module [Ectothiorhodosinus mongolicus]